MSEQNEAAMYAVLAYNERKVWLCVQKSAPKIKHLTEELADAAIAELEKVCPDLKYKKVELT